MKKRGKVILGFIQLFVAIGALPAGYLLFSQPDGQAMGMNVNQLSGSPFRDFFIPGLFLFTVNGIFNLVCSVLSFIKFRHVAILGTGLGIALIIWICVQIYSVGLIHFLQPLYFFIGIAEIVLSIYIYKTEKLNINIS
jgi:hypothetical protein